VRIQQRAVHVDHQQPVGVRTGPPRRRSGVGACRAQPGKPVGIASDLLHHPPRRRRGGDRAKQRWLLAQHGQIAQAVAAVGQHHRKVPQHLTPSMAVPAGLGATRPPGKRPGQPEPVGQLHQQRHPGMSGDPIAVAGDLKAWTWADSLHPQGALP
jgi:hypothetical protein